MTGPLPDWLGPISRPLARLYGTGIQWRNAWYDADRGVRRVDRPVISVGNVTAGGTGKSPTVAWIARCLIDAGHRPVIAMRGYGSRGGPSDEAEEYREKLPNTDLVIDPDRVGALRRFLSSHPEVDCVLLDDGFQHRRLHRDLDVVLVDASVERFGQPMLPAGFAREPVASLARAHAVVVTRAEAIDDDLTRMIESAHGRPPVAWTRHGWAGVWGFGASGRMVETPDVLRGRRLVTMFGVGDPESVREQVRSSGATIAADIPVRDHHAYDAQAVERARMLMREADGLVVTMKDWVKLRGLIDFGLWTKPIFVPQVELDFISGRATLIDMVLRVAADN